MQKCRRWIVSGKIQGVGFRPFVYQLAHQYSLNGWVRNNLGQVEIHCEGKTLDLDHFHTSLISHSPTISTPEVLSCEACETSDYRSFQILQSNSACSADIHIPSDFYTCPDCLAEMQNEKDRRYRYPFINCTQCGPRYTLIEKLPYDRPNTSMEEFPLCDNCLEEYQNPLNRRFHAEPVACPVCGPLLTFKDTESEISGNEQAIQASIQALNLGKIVAVKGIGGYHLMCDASNDIAVQQLRKLKGRPHKPLAVMFPAAGKDDLDIIHDYLILDKDEADLLRSPGRPILLTKKKQNKLSPNLSRMIAPDLSEIGAMLAYSPLHHLLLNTIGKPLVATSANISGEPVLTDETEVEQRLSHISKVFLHHNRRIVRPADDSVFRQINGKMRPIRLGRGHVPIEITLPFKIKEPILACGSHMKNTVALAWENRMVVSPHIGDLDSPRSMDVFAQTIADLQELYQVKASSVVCDAHPAYASTRWATQCNMPCTNIQHHKAHASALVLEQWNKSHTNDEPWLVFCWDGTGYGDDGSIWGAEAFYGRPGQWERVASFRQFRLPGGEKAGREPWRSASALCWEENQQWDDCPVDTNLLKQAWQQGINSPRTSAMGRLFDAAAAMTGLINEASFEGQAPMLLEQKCNVLFEIESLPLSKDQNGILIADWAGLIPELQDTNKSLEQRATLFHSQIAHTLLQQVETLQQDYPFKNIGISGGVFQNRKLSEYLLTQLKKRNYRAYMAETLPVNDASISAGQIVEAAMTTNSIKG